MTVYSTTTLSQTNQTTIPTASQTTIHTTSPKLDPVKSVMFKSVVITSQCTSGNETSSTSLTRVTSQIQCAVQCVRDVTCVYMGYTASGMCEMYSAVSVLPCHQKLFLKHVH